MARGPISSDTARPQSGTAAGLGYAVLAYGSWGLFPLFWKLLDGIASLELVAHRVVWSCAAYVALLVLLGRAHTIVPTLRARGTLAKIVPTALLIGLNWLVFVYAIATDRVLHASLGYFLNPLVSIVLGLVFLGERMRAGQWVAVALASLGVVQLAGLTEGVPWIALVLAVSFGCYGLLRKLAPVDGLMGATLEAVLLAPVAAVYLLVSAFDGTGAMGRHGAGIDALLVCAGIVTAAPLVWFANAARLLPLRTLGFVQYLAPSSQFVLAVAVFGEPLTEIHVRAFACIWGAVALFSLESWWQSRRARLAPGG